MFIISYEYSGGRRGGATTGNQKNTFYKKENVFLKPFST
jgi:hypothetical protein